MNISFRDPLLPDIWQKLRQGGRLSPEEGLILYSTNDIIALGRMANFIQMEKSGDAVYFVLNRKIEHTNICLLSCRFCNFSRKKGDLGAYEMTVEEIVSRITPEIREVHITGGMPADWEWDRYLGIVRAIREKYPDTDIKAYTAVEIDFFHKKFKLSVKEVLNQLRAAGLQTMPGGGAEIFSERVRKKLFPQKIGAKGYLEVHRAAHKLGIPTNCTMLYGHIETTEERLAHMIKLRELQDETNGFLTFIPLAFQPGNTGIRPRGKFTSAVDDLKTIAVSRLMLDNFPHIKAYWVMLTEEVASVALNFGADDIDGTVGDERIAHDAGALSPTRLAKERILEIIRCAGKLPVERDALYNPLRVHSDGVIGKIPYLNSVLFYNGMEKREFRILPVTPRRMGILSKNGEIDAGLFSLIDYFDQENSLELLGWCLAARDRMRSVILFSKQDWAGLRGKKIGVTDDTSTSVRLLNVILEKKYCVKSEFVRLKPRTNDYSGFDGLLLIGDEALKRNRSGTDGFGRAFDLAAEWSAWQKLPFVFAVWACKKSLPDERKKGLREMISKSFSESESKIDELCRLYSRKFGQTENEIKEYLQSFNYRLGEHEHEAMRKFREILM